MNDKFEMETYKKSSINFNIIKWMLLRLTGGKTDRQTGERNAIFSKNSVDDKWRLRVQILRG